MWKLSTCNHFIRCDESSWVIGKISNITIRTQAIICAKYNHWYFTWKKNIAKKLAFLKYRILETGWMVSYSKINILNQTWKNKYHFDIATYLYDPQMWFLWVNKINHDWIERAVTHEIHRHISPNIVSKLNWRYPSHWLKHQNNKIKWNPQKE